MGSIASIDSVSTQELLAIDGVPISKVGYLNFLRVPQLEIVVAPASLTRLTDPEKGPGASVYAVSWYGDSLAVAQGVFNSQSLQHYGVYGESLHKLYVDYPTTTNAYAAAFSGDYLVVGVTGSSSYLRAYKQDGVFLRLQGTPSSPGSTVFGVAWSYGGHYLAVCKSNTFGDMTGLAFYMRHENTLIKKNTPPPPGGRGVGAVWIGNYLFVAVSGSTPTLVAYRLNTSGGDVSLDKLPEISNTPADNIMDIKVNGRFIAVTSLDEPYLRLYEWDSTTESLTLVHGIGSPLPERGAGLAWNKNFLAVGYMSYPWLSVYRLDGGNLIKELDAEGLHDYPRTLSLNNNNKLAAGFLTSPHLLWFDFVPGSAE